MSVDGTALIQPPETLHTDFLVFGDIYPIDANVAETVARELAGTALQFSKTGIYADFEQAPCQTAIFFLQILQQELSKHNQRLLIPEAYAAHLPTADVVLFWRPSDGAFEKILRKKSKQYEKHLWLDYAPVCLKTQLPWSAAYEQRMLPKECAAFLLASQQTVQYSEQLFCNYVLQKQEKNYVLYLFDTAMTIKKKAALAEQYALQGILTLYPELTAHLQASFPDADL